jgi:hypothetical protein
VGVQSHDSDKFISNVPHFNFQGDFSFFKIIQSESNFKLVPLPKIVFSKTGKADARQGNVLNDNIPPDSGFPLSIRTGKAHLFAVVAPELEVSPNHRSAFA